MKLDFSLILVGQWQPCVPLFFNVNEQYIRQQILIMDFVFSQNNTEVTKQITFVIEMLCAFFEVKV